MKHKNYTKYSDNNKQSEQVIPTPEVDNKDENVMEMTEEEKAVRIAEIEETLTLDMPMEKYEALREELNKLKGDSLEDENQNDEDVDNEDINDEESEEPEEPVTKVKGVVNVAKLNVRSGAYKDAGVLTILTKGTEVMVDLGFENSKFYKVTVTNELNEFDAYCMKEFIDIE